MSDFNFNLMFSYVDCGRTNQLLTELRYIICHVNGTDGWTDRTRPDTQFPMRPPGGPLAESSLRTDPLIKMRGRI